MTMFPNPIFELHFLMGLPASGKSYWARQNFNENTLCNHTGDFIVDLDKYLHYENGKLTTPVIYSALNNSDMKYYVGGELQNTRKTVKVCIDGLITTMNDLDKVITDTLNYIHNRYDGCDYQVNLYIHQWNEDRETCLHNDRLRMKSGERNESSETTIRIRPYEYIQKKQLQKYKDEDNHVVSIKVESHTVKNIDTYDTIFAPLIGYDKTDYHNNTSKKTQYMYSESWSAGGSWGDCWGNEGTISPDSPLDFREFDDLLMKICPDISFMNYKKLLNECTETEKYSEYDYYGGREYRQRWKCDMKRLYELLNEMNYITNEDK